MLIVFYDQKVEMCNSGISVF